MSFDNGAQLCDPYANQALSVTPEGPFVPHPVYPPCPDPCSIFDFVSEFKNVSVGVGLGEVVIFRVYFQMS